MPGNENSMASMIQILSALSSMQNQRRELSLREQEFEAQKDQTAQALGFQQKSAEYKKFADFLDMAARLPTEARGNLQDAAKAAGLPDQMATAIATLAMNAPDSLENIKRRVTQQGLGQVNSGEVASTTLTGQNLGGQGISGMQAALANPQAVTPQMQQGFAQKAATGQTPLDAAIQSRVAGDPGLMSMLTRITAGGMTPYQSSEVGIGQRNAATAEAGVRQTGISEEMNIAKDMVIAGFTKGRNATQQASYLRILQNQQKMAENPKLSPAERMQLKAQFNTMADQFGFPNLKYQSAEDKGQATLLDQLLQTLTPYEGQPQPQAQPNPISQFLPQQQGAPTQPAAPFGQTPWAPQLRMPQ